MRKLLVNLTDLIAAFYFEFIGESVMKRFFTGIAATVALCSAIGSALAADIVATAATAGTFKIFAAAVKTAGFAEALKNPGPYTVFAPTDEAFAKLPAGTWDALSKDKVQLAQVLSYHVIPGKVMVTEVKPGKAKTVQGGPLTLTSDNGKMTVNNANITQSDIVADNGVIHAIDTVLMPPN
jgi:uncharacterized surface protein with fasciclin (FAS1) repeats